MGLWREKAVILGKNIRVGVRAPLVLVVCTIYLGCVQTKRNLELLENQVGQTDQLLTN